MDISKKVSVPKVSIIVPAYNVRTYVETALLSLESQPLQDFEALIVDDGSTDDTTAVVKPFCQRDSRFRSLQKQNGGLSSARNYGIRHARADYNALLDADDVYAPNKLLTHVERLDRDAAIGVVDSASRIIRDDGKPTFMVLSGKSIQSDPLLALLCKNFVGHGSNTVFRHIVCDEVGEFDETLPSFEDVDSWLRIAATRKWRFYRDPRVLCCYRVRLSGLSFDVTQRQHSSEKVLESAYRRSPSAKRVIGRSLGARKSIQSKNL